MFISKTGRKLIGQAYQAWFKTEYFEGDVFTDPRNHQPLRPPPKSWEPTNTTDPALFEAHFKTRQGDNEFAGPRGRYITGDSGGGPIRLGGGVREFP